MVILGSSTAQQDEAFTKELGTAVGWWHWISDSWLIHDPHDRMDVQTVRDKVLTCYPKVRNMVFEIRSDGTDSWAGYGPSSAPQDMGEWLRKNWKKG